MYCVHLLFAIQIGISWVSSLSIPLNDTMLVSTSGFGTKIEFGNEPLNPIGVYILAIDAMREWSKNAWNSEFKGTIGVIDPQFGITIKCVEIVQSKKSPSVQMGDVLLGLQSGVVAW